MIHYVYAVHRLWSAGKLHIALNIEHSFDSPFYVVYGQFLSWWDVWATFKTCVGVCAYAFALYLWIPPIAELEVKYKKF